MDSTETKQCYYDILQVDIKATDEEIKRSFKKLSLKNHPDRNRNNIEEAKKKYQEITEAYNVISDPKQREWYDKNRDKLLVDKSEMTKEELQQQAYGFDIFAHMTEDCFEGFDESENGFYTVYGKAFEILNKEEEKAFKFISKKDEQYTQLPAFGTSKTDIKEVVAFYDAWKNFMSIKSFAWVDQHDARDAENRYEKRQMEQENERERRKEKKKYVQNVKDLVAFVKKLDPRREQLLELEKQEEQRILQQRELFKSDKQKKKEQKLKEQEERKRQKQEEENKRFEELERQRLELLAQQEKEAKEQQQQEFTCKVCNKSFESSKKLGNHRKSQQHKDEVAKQQGEQDKNDAIQQKADEESLKALKAIDPSKLTKKQAKELKKLEAQAKAKETQKAQQLKQKEKAQEKAQQQQEDEEDNEEDNDEESKNDGEKKKRKRNRKKKAANQTEQTQESQQNGNGQQQQEQQQAQEEDDGWNQIQGSAKTMKKINKENKKQKKSSGEGKN